MVNLIPAKVGTTSELTKNPPTETVRGLQFRFASDAGHLASLDAGCTYVKALW